MVKINTSISVFLLIFLSFFFFFFLEFVGFPRSIEQVLGSWRGLFVGRKRKDVQRARPLCLFWTHWNARNKVFEDKVLSIQKLKPP